MLYNEITKIFKDLNTPNNKRLILLERKYPELNKELISLTNFLPKRCSISERLYCLKNDISENQKCKHCGIKSVPFLIGKNRYQENCSVKCSLHNKSNRENRKKNSLKKYGVEHPMQSQEVKEEVKKTNRERYGVDWVFQDKDFKNNATKVIKEKYGVEKIGLSKEIQDKIKQTNLERYRVEYPLQNEEIYNKTIDNQDINYYNNKLKDNPYIKPLFSEFDYSSEKNLDWMCIKCETKYNSKIDFLSFSRFNYPIRCTKCFPWMCGTSDLEKEVIDFVKNIYVGEIIENSKSIISPLELDIYIPNKNIAIEFNGLYWHSENQGKDKNYHLNKTKLCEKHDIHLIHIFENEWLYKQDIVKSRLKNLLGIYDKRIYARNCIIKEIDNKTTCDFLNENHLQNSTKTPINIGLFYNNELISVMTFSKTRFSKKYEYELVRFCNKLNYSVVGSAGKMLKHFEKEYNPKSLVSYADRRWSYSKKNLYDSLGFKLINISKPNYWYFKNDNCFLLESRVKYQKHKLKNLLGDFDKTKTEIENMRMNGYNRIFDCGNLVYVKEY